MTDQRWLNHEAAPLLESLTDTLANHRLASSRRPWVRFPRLLQEDVSYIYSIMQPYSVGAVCFTIRSAWNRWLFLARYGIGNRERCGGGNRKLDPAAYRSLVVGVGVPELLLQVGLLVNDRSCVDDS